jgi:predicted DNA-binding protein
MSLTISLPSEAEAMLRQRAKSAGRDVSEYVQELIAKELAAPLSLAEAAEPIARAVDAAGVSEEDFTSTIEEAHEAARRDRHRRPG